MHNKEPTCTNIKDKHVYINENDIYSLYTE